MFRRRSAVVAVAFAAALAIGNAVNGDTTAETFASNVSADGTIALPKDFRANMVHLGSWFVPEGDASGLHDVYTERASAVAFRESGRFPDGATLVKELRVSRAANYTTGPGVSSATSKVKQWFVMVKDERNRFPSSPNWGEGWGWALFKPEDPSKNLATDYQSDCLGCHIPAKSTDFIYSDAYPTLKR